jgi:hypothetical protein
MKTTNLEKILSDVATIAPARAEFVAQLTKIHTDRDETIANATGHNDRTALEKLSVLASQESIVSNQLRLLDRRLAGLHPQAMNEATHVRAGVLEYVTARRDAFIAKWKKANAPFYETADEVDAALDILIARKQPPVLRRIGKTISGLHSARLSPGQTELEYARTVLSAAGGAGRIGE